MSGGEDKVIEIFSEALAKAAPEERKRYLTAACGQDLELRRQVEALLDAHLRAGDFLKGNVVAPSTGTEGPGMTIGRYKLLQQIGEGGCGVVYLAEQQEPVQRRVALKVIKLGMDTRQVIARFEAERQALALMEHPNIAKVLDAGATETGRPYFVMELVRGTKITDYCDENNLSTPERLNLFLQVCRAIQHAHQKGVIHRDIKPSNILVTLHDGVPVPKVIDFGIAKATQGRLTNKTVFTAFEQFIGTPAYMSPEQAEMSGLDIDTRSDIYSLGVLLYELLTGKTPFDSEELLQAGLEAMRRIIREKEPEKPSTKLSTMLAGDLTKAAKRRRTEPPRLVSAVRGDLDWVAMKCLEKDRSRRYETANGLADDLQRHLKQEPVEACPPSKLYRLHKMIRRNRVTFTTVAAVAVAILAGLLVSTLLLIKERAAKREQSRLLLLSEANGKKALIAAAKDKQIAEFLKDTFKGVGPSVALGRDTKLLREVIDKSLHRISQELTNQPEVRAELLSELGNVYFEVGDYEKAESLAREALTLQTGLFGEVHKDVGGSLNNLAIALEREGKLEEAEAAVRRALAIATQLWGGTDEHVSRALDTLGGVLHARGKLAEAEEVQRRALGIERKCMGNSHASMAGLLHNLSGTLWDEGRLAEAEALARESLEIKQKLFGNEHPDVAFSLNQLALILHNEGKMSEAETLKRQVLEIARKFWGPDHEYIAASLGNLSGTLAMQGYFSDAESLEMEALQMRRRLWGSEHPDIAESLANLGFLRNKQGRMSEAEPLLLEALTMRKKLLGPEHPRVASALNNLAWCLQHQIRLEEAEDLYRAALRIQQKAFPARPAQWVLDNVAAILLERGKTNELHQLFNEWLDSCRRDSSQSAAVLGSRSNLLGRQGHWAEATTDAEKAHGLEPKEANTGHTLVILQLAQENPEAYRQACQNAFACFTGTNEAISASAMAVDCLALPPCSVDIEQVSRLANTVDSVRTNNFFLPQFQFCKALADYRQGRFAEAVEWSSKALTSSGHRWDDRLRVEANAVLAMARWQLNKPDAARAALAEAQQLANTKLPHPDSGDLGEDWRDWVIAQTLLKEARGVVGTASR